MKWTTIVAALAVIVSVNSADAGLFGGHHKRSDSCCAPSCCAPAEAACCPDPCCAAPCEPACCAPDACAAPCADACAAPCAETCCPAPHCGKHRRGLFRGGRGLFKGRGHKRGCCDTGCAPSCCAPVDACCAAPVGCCN
jgi:hypothetical protein